MKNKIKILLYILIAAYLFMLTFMYFGQHGAEYQPKIKTEEEFQSASRSIEAEVITYKSHDGLELDSIYYPADYNKPIFLYFNGNAGTIEQAYRKFEPFINEGYGVFINVFRGFGANEGIPSEEDFFADAETVYDWLLDVGYEEKEIIIYGYSLGTGVAVYLSSIKPESKLLIVEGGFTSATDVAEAWFPYLPVEFLLKDKYESEDYIKKVKQPKLHLHGKDDLKVPTKFGQELYDAGGLPKCLSLYDKGTHGNLHELGATRKVAEFIKKYP